jgi:hypothetical protein
VLAVNATELSRHPSRAEAEAAMTVHLDAVHMRLPTAEEIAAEVAKYAAAEDRITSTIAAAKKRQKALLGAE